MGGAIDVLRPQPVGHVTTWGSDHLASPPRVITARDHLASPPWVITPRDHLASPPWVITSRDHRT